MTCPQSDPSPPSEPPPPCGHCCCVVPEPCDCTATLTALRTAHPASFPSRSLLTFGYPPFRHGPYLHHARTTCRPTCGARWDAVLNLTGITLR